MPYKGGEMDFTKVTEAFAAFTKLLQDADECRVRFEEVRIELPEPLRRLLGSVDSTSANSNGNGKSIRIDPHVPATRPVGVPDSWICVPLSKSNLQTLVLGVLRAANEPVPPRGIIAEGEARGIHVNDGSLGNIGTRLEKAKTIERREDEGWVLMDTSRAPILSGPYAWGASEWFNVHELAARRREVILHILGYFRDGLQNMQILTQLGGCPWLKTPFSKDLLKVDMLELQKEGKVKRGSSRKWALAD